MTQALLIIGAMGTGKSDASYHLFSRLYADGVPTARLDLDDLGMCHPAPDDDPDNLAVKAEAMAAAWNVFQRHGARCLIVSGALDTAEAIERVTGQIPAARWTVTRLRIAPDERRGRVHRRAMLLGATEESTAATMAAGDADELALAGRDLPGTVIDTDGMTSVEVVDAILATTGFPTS